MTSAGARIRSRALARRRAFHPELWSAIAATLALASCAPPAPAPSLDADLLRTRYSQALEDREHAARSVVAQVSLWTTLDGRHLPGALAELTLAAPDRCRLRVSSPGGTLLDAVGSGQVLRAWLPSEKTLADLTACADSAGVRDLPELAVQTAAALWRPANWNAVRRVPASGASSWLEWADAERTIRLRVTSEGLPDTVVVRGAEGAAVTIAYLEWMRAGSAQLPRELRVTSADARSALRCRVSRMRIRAVADSSLFAGPGPRDAAHEDGCELWRMMKSGGDP